MRRRCPRSKDRSTALARAAKRRIEKWIRSPFGVGVDGGDATTIMMIEQHPRGGWKAGRRRKEALFAVEVYTHQKIIDMQIHTA